MNTKIYSYLIWALILWIIGVLLLQNKSIQTQETSPQTIVDTGTIIDSWSLLTGIQEDSLVYTNTEYWFQLTLPEGWEDYKSIWYDMSENPWFSGLIIRIVFALPTSDTTRYGIIDPNDKNWLIPSYTGQYQYIKWYADMMILNVWTYEWYQKAINIQDSMLSKENRLSITWGSGKQYVYTFDWPQDLPIDISEKKKTRDSQWKGDYFQEIKKTFKIL